MLRVTSVWSSGSRLTATLGVILCSFFFFSSRRRHTRCLSDWSSDVCSSDLIVLGPFFLLIPGVANLPAAYFGFRVVGHCLSLPGARQGLRYVTWSGRPAAPLDTLRDLGAVPAHERDARVHDVAERLQLPQFPRFFERVAARHA